MPQITGKIKFIDPAKRPDEQKDFTVRTFAIESEDEVNGQIYTNAIVMQVVGDRCQLLDSMNIGDEVAANYGVRGIIKVKEGKPTTEKNPSGLDGFNNITATSIKKTDAQVANKDGTKAATKPTKQESWDAQNKQNTTPPASSEIDDLPF